MKWPLQSKSDPVTVDTGLCFLKGSEWVYVMTNRKLKRPSDGVKMSFSLILMDLTCFELESGFDLCKRASRALEVIV